MLTLALGRIWAKIRGGAVPTAGRRKEVGTSGVRSENFIFYSVFFVHIFIIFTNSCFYFRSLKNIFLGGGAGV